MLPILSRRRTQAVKGEVCKTSMQRFESARRLQLTIYFSFNNPSPRPRLTKKSSGFVPTSASNPRRLPLLVPVKRFALGLGFIGFVFKSLSKFRNCLGLVFWDKVRVPQSHIDLLVA